MRKIILFLVIIVSVALNAQTKLVKMKAVEPNLLYFQELNGKAYFVAKNSFGYELWVTNGSFTG